MIMEGNGCIDLVVGLGETGRPLKEILEQAYPTASRDIEPADIAGKIGALHICYPFQVGDFVATTAGYIAQYHPELTIIHSTVIPGTTRQIYERTGDKVAYSPIRGKHTHMREQLMTYTKFVAGATPEAAAQAADHLAGAGLHVRPVSTCESLELAKLVETTYFGLLIAWAQEVERFCAHVGASYEDVMLLTEDVKYLPPVVFQPGFIGGHCVMPNILLLQQACPSAFLELIQASNEQKKTDWQAQGRDLNERIAPKPNIPEPMSAALVPAASHQGPQAHQAVAEASVGHPATGA
jgi:hypothetical protein